MKMFVVLGILAVAGHSLAMEGRCSQSITTASGRKAPGGFCAGDLIFEDNFDFLDSSKWAHEVTLAGGGNWEFQWYVNDRTNSYTQNGVLHIKPTLTSDIYGEGFLKSGRLQLGAECTNSDNWGCDRTGTQQDVLNPVRSARVRTVDSFSFKYGRVEVRAKLPAGDWLWPAIWLLPTQWKYGGWPRSGEIDIMESRGNRNMVAGGVNIGPEQIGSTLHFGPDPSANGWSTAHYQRNTAAGRGYNQDFHRFQLEWTPDHLTFKVDDIELGTVWVGSGFYDRGGFGGYAAWAGNPWAGSGRDAPFDQQFHLIMNLAVGGTNQYFPDGVSNPGGKPWGNSAAHAYTDFWNGRNQWLPTWNYNQNADSHFQVDYVRVWAL